jgi:selenium-binding protein 1
MLQLSLDGKRLYATNSLFSTWDNVFYPELKKDGSWLVQILTEEKKGMIWTTDVTRMTQIRARG